VENRYEDDAVRRLRRERRRREMRRRKRRRAMIKKMILSGMLALTAAVALAVWISRGKEGDSFGKGTMPQAVREVLAAAAADRQAAREEQEQSERAEEPAAYSYTDAEDMLHPGSELISSHAILVDVDGGKILAGKEERSRMVPASMTKVLTLLTAVEQIENLDDRFAVPAEAVDYSFKNRCSCAGFEKEELVTVRDLLYGTVLPSGAEAAMGLAIYVSGSQEAFVELMNAKLEELGLSETAHFTNCVGVYGEDHYCTAYDMAVIMQAALADETCREVLSARTYLTSGTEQHPEGLLLSNWFLRRIEDTDVGDRVSAAKTGFVDESKFCAVSYGTDGEGRGYICVTANAPGNWKCINDHVWLYSHFL
jgi:D-alanyl-D-alanine carboxypeptidase